jgi:hypothetical protein
VLTKSGQNLVGINLNKERSMVFRPGQSGNPKGRPKGIADKRIELRSLLELHAEELVEKLIERAKAGDSMALRLCVERLIPRVKPDLGITFELPEGDINAGENMLEIANRITQAVVCGLLTIEEAEKFTGFLKRQRWLINEAHSKQRDEEWKKKISEGY